MRHSTIHWNRLEDAFLCYLRPVLRNRFTLQTAKSYRIKRSPVRVSWLPACCTNDCWRSAKLRFETSSARRHRFALIHHEIPEGPFLYNSDHFLSTRGQCRVGLDAAFEKRPSGDYIKFWRLKRT